MREDLRGKCFSAAFWSALDLVCRQGIQFGVSVALARLLAPKEFGVIAMLLLFTALAGSFVEAGFCTALIQKKEVTEDDTSSVFYFNLTAGLIVALSLCGAAGWIAEFYQAPILRPLTELMALNLFLGAFGAVHRALLIKKLDFRTQMRISVVATALPGGLAVYLAWRGWGVWSLAWQTVLSTMVTTSLLWLWHPWRPVLRFRITALRSLFRFGSYMFYSGLLNTACSKMYTLLIGRLYSPADLGFYARADSTQQLPATLLSTVVDRVAFPVFSAVSGDDQLLRTGLSRAVTHLMLINLPVSLGMLAVARPLVMTLFGARWLPCVPYLQILCLAGALWPLHVINLSCLMAKGRSELFFRLEVCKKVVGIAALLVAASISTLAMAWSQVFTGFFCFFLNAHFTGVLLGYSPLRQLRDIAPAGLAAGVMLGAVVAISRLEIQTSTAQLSLQVLTGALVYGAVCHSAGITAFRQLREQIAAQFLHGRAAKAQAL